MDIMLDLETMGQGPDAAIVAIGAVEMDFENNCLGNEFYSTVKLNCEFWNGGEIDADTVLWWMKQEDAARKEITSAEATLDEVLGDLSSWLRKYDRKELKVWGNGSEFDNVILLRAYKRNYHGVGPRYPWEYYNNRCYRTVKKLYPHIKMQRAGVHHNALDDAKSQATHLIEIMRSVRSGATK